MSTPPSSTDIKQAAQRLLQGGLVAFPTETVYGLGADAENPQAIAAIYQAKGRPSDHPVIVHVARQANLSYWAASVPPEAAKLVKAFWPGPLTLILPRAAHIPDAVSGGQDSIGLRCPSHPVACALLAEFARLKGGNGGVAAPSANKFGQVSPTRPEHVRAEFPELDDSKLLVLDGGPAQVGIESTILDLSRLHQGVGPVLLRPGHISPQDIAAVLGVLPAAHDAQAPRVSGALKAHYAPHTPLVLYTLAAIQQWLGKNAPSVAPPGAVSGKVVTTERMVVMGLGSAPAELPLHVLWHAMPQTPKAYASALYDTLRRLDAAGHTCIVAQQPPHTEDWQAVNDRLGRAAAAFQE